MPGAQAGRANLPGPAQQGSLTTPVLHTSCSSTWLDHHSNNDNNSNVNFIVLSGRKQTGCQPCKFHLDFLQHAPQCQWQRLHSSDYASSCCLQVLSERCLYAANGAVMRTVALRVRDSLTLRSTSKVSEFDAYRKLAMYLDFLIRNIYNRYQRIICNKKPCELFVG